jgi:hypothetical protein
MREPEVQIEKSGWSVFNLVVAKALRSPDRPPRARAEGCKG